MTDDDGATEPVVRIEQHDDFALVETKISDPIVLPLKGTAELGGSATRFTLGLEAIRPKSDIVARDQAEQFVSDASNLAYDFFTEAKRCDPAQLKAVSDVVTAQLVLASDLYPARYGTEIVTLGSQYLPWEWLGGRLTDPDSGLRTSTLGLSTVCWRRLERGADSPNRFLQAAPAQIRLFHHLDLAAVQAELKYFVDHNRDFFLLGPLPIKSDPTEFDLAQHIFDRSIDCGERKSLAAGDQMLHITCHHGLHQESYRPSDFRTAALIDSALEFSDTERRFVVRVRDFENKLGRLLRDSTGDRGPGPLAFVNACRGQFHPWSSTNLARILLEYGSRAVISTIAKVPAKVATALSIHFYEELLAGATCANALRSATHALLRTTGSPLGTLYTYAGDPDLQLERSA